MLKVHNYRKGQDATWFDGYLGRDPNRAKVYDRRKDGSGPTSEQLREVVNRTKFRARERDVICIELCQGLRNALGVPDEINRIWLVYSRFKNIVKVVGARFLTKNEVRPGNPPEVEAYRTQARSGPFEVSEHHRRRVQLRNPMKVFRSRSGCRRAA